MREEEKKTETPNSASVLRYLTILFVAAFALLLFTLAMERRQNAILQQQNQEQISDLQQNITAVQSLRNLYDENDTLKEQLYQLQQELNTLNNQLAEIETERTKQTQTAEEYHQSLQAMDWFWQIDEAYVRGRYSLCRQLIAQMTEAGLDSCLPTVSVTDTGRFSPAQRLEEIQNKLG